MDRIWHDGIISKTNENTQQISSINWKVFNSQQVSITCVVQQIDFNLMDSIMLKKVFEIPVIKD